MQLTTFILCYFKLECQLFSFGVVTLFDTWICCEVQLARILISSVLYHMQRRCDHLLRELQDNLTFLAN